MAKERKSSPRRRRPPKNRQTRAAKAAAGAEKAEAESPLGRPHELTQKRIDDICTALGVCASIKDAAEFAGVAEATYHRWMERAKHAFQSAQLNPAELPPDWRAHVDPEEHIFCDLRERATRARADAKIGLLGSIVLAGKGGPLYDENGNVVANIDGDWRASAKMLAVRDPESYAERHKHELSGAGGEPLGVVIYLPEEEDEP